MSHPDTGMPDAESYVPKWTDSRFVVIDRTGRWASAISAEANSSGDVDSVILTFESCTSTRDAVDFVGLKNTVGFILFLDGLERECLSFLGRLGRSHHHSQLLAVASDKHRDLLPVIMEAGVESVLFNVCDDIPVAGWARRVAKKLQRPE